MPSSPSFNLFKKFGWKHLKCYGFKNNWKRTVNDTWKYFICGIVGHVKRGIITEEPYCNRCRLYQKDW